MCVRFNQILSECIIVKKKLFCLKTCFAVKMLINKNHHSQAAWRNTPYLDIYIKIRLFTIVNLGVKREKYFKV